MANFRSLSFKIILLGSVIILGFNLPTSLSYGGLNCTLTDPQFRASSNIVLEYRDFTSVSQLNVCCDFITFSFRNSIRNIVFDFCMKKVFDQSINLECLYTPVRIRSISFHCIENFEVTITEPILLIKYDIFLYIIKSKLKFVYKGVFIDQKRCHELANQNFNFSLFSGMQKVSIIVAEDVDISEPICPYIFNNAYINKLNFLGLTTSQIERRDFSFIPEYRGTLINSSVSILAMNIYKLNLSNLMVNENVFKNIGFLLIDGRPGYIQDDLFVQLRSLNYLEIHVHSIMQMFTSYSNKWLASIRFEDVDFETIQERIDALNDQGNAFVFRLSFLEDSGSFEYSDGDFCLFKYFPFKKFISFEAYKQTKLVSEFIQIQNETCLSGFLLQNMFLLFGKDYNRTRVEEHEHFLNKCDVIETLSACFNVSSFGLPKSSSLYFGEQDLVYTLKWLEFIGPVISFPIVSAIGFILNLLTILVILKKRNAKEQLVDSKMFKYILLNSSFNCAECLIYQFKLMTTCIGIDSLFCSSIVFTRFSYYFSIIVNGYLSETMKSCSILTGLLFSLQRYVETSKTANRFLVAFSKVRMRFITFLLIGYGLLISIFKFYDYLDFDGVGASTMHSPERFHINFYIQSDSKIIDTVFFLNYILNDFVILLVNLIIDMKLVILIKSNLKLKVEMRMKNLEKSSKTDKKRLREEIDNKRKVENKANSMIVLNLIVYFFCRLPELLSIIFFYFEGFFSFVQMCSENTLCYLLSDTIEYLYMISYIFNFFFYYRFNLEFKRNCFAFFGLFLSEK